MHVTISGAGAAPLVVTTEGGRVEDLLAAVAAAGADHATVIAGDGYRASIPLAMLCRDGVMTIENDGLRLRVEDGTTLCWNVKDVVAFEFTAGRAEDDVPENPPH